MAVRKRRWASGGEDKSAWIVDYFDILNAASGRWRPLIVTAVFTGLRASELRGLR
jgi:hypothetical protein